MEANMIILKFAAVTCAFYMVAALLLQISLIELAHLSGMSGVLATRIGWTLIFGIVWLASFLLAWHVVINPPSSRAAN
jgi:hypothetical protein